MSEDRDPITNMGTDYGCMYCGSKIDKFYFIEYYMLPRKMTRKRHKEKERFVLVCDSCYESNRTLTISIDDRPFAVSKSGCRDLDNLKCVICHTKINHDEIKGVISSLQMMGGSGIESKPLAFLCSDCVEKHLLEF